jgi:hypothetical protein
MPRMLVRLAAIGILAALLPGGAGTAAPEGEHQPRFWFPLGEKITYKLYWGIIPVGRAWFEATPVRLGTRECLSLRGRAKTNAIVATIFPIDDDVQSFVDCRTFLPVRYRQNLREGRKRRNELVTFDHRNGKAYWENLDNHEVKIIEIESDTRDVLTLTYAMREKGLEVGQIARFQVLVEDKLYDLEGRALQTETVDVGRYGEVECLKVEPKAKFGEIFVRKGRVFMWFTNDDRRLCTRMTALLPFANLKAVLEKVEGPGDDRWVKP